MMLREIRYAVRSLWHSRGFTIVGILCLGLGIGINTTIFSIIDGVLLKPYPYDDPDRILVLETVQQQDGDGAGVSIADLRRLEDLDEVVYDDRRCRTKDR